MIKDNKDYNEQVSPNSDFIESLRKKLPEFFSSEGYFDLKKFKSNLSENNVNELKDGYQLDFIGKDYARRQSGERPTTVVVPDEEQNNGEGKDSNNLFFTGDNIEVLRHMQGAYSESIDVIYIDPPYNTGNNDFIYPDTFEYTDEKMKKIFGMDDEHLKRLKSIQGKSNHSAWLTFMYPRIVLAKHLLTENGVIFISIDDNEDSNLKEICDEIFGEDNFLSQIIWQRAYSPVNLKKNFSTSHDYILAYGRNASIIESNGIRRSDDADDRYKNPDNDNRGVWASSDISVGPAIESNIYPIVVPSGREVLPPNGRSWSFSKKDFEEKVKDNRIWFGTDGNGVPRVKRFKSELKKTGITPMTIWTYDEVGHSQEATQYLTKLMNGKRYFTYPKPVKLIQRLIHLYSNKDSTILDFFAGSSTTAEAVIRENLEDQGNRKFIMVQLPERTYTEDKNGKEVPTSGGRIAYEDGFKSIDEISRFRIKQVAKNIISENELTLPDNFDMSFKHYRFVNPSIDTLDYIDNFDPNNISLFNDVLQSLSSDSLNITGNSDGKSTVINTWLMNDGYKLNAKVQDIDIDGYKANVIDNNQLYLIDNGWKTNNLKKLLNLLGNYELSINTIVLFGYSFNLAEIKELEIGLKQLDMNVNLLKRY